MQHLSAMQYEQNMMHAMLEKSPTGVIYGFAISWTDLNGGKRSIKTTGFYTARDARRSVVRAARRSGWTYPRWWQFWRWDDTRPNLDFTDV